MSERHIDPTAPFRTISAEDPAVAARSPRLKLVVITGPDLGAELVLPAANEIGGTVGTDPTCALVLTDPTVSRRHMVVTLVDGGVSMRDLGSRNGSMYQGGRFSEIVVPPGAVVRVGRSELRVIPEGLRDSLPPSTRDRFGELHGASLAMRQLYAVLERVAPSDVPVLLEGETGTGKELAAEALHASSRRANGPFVVCDLAGVARTLIEAELFGHVRGAFTGADRDRDGAFVQASGGTLFIDEIGEMDLELQPRLLRALERRQVKPVGGSSWRAADVRVIAATNRDLTEEVRQGRFRDDLYHRLAVVRVRLPALRERKEDIPVLVQHLLSRAAEPLMQALQAAAVAAAGGANASSMAPGDPANLAVPTTLEVLPPAVIPPETMALLMTHDWPGNVRELKNVLDRGLSLVLPPEGAPPGTAPQLTPELLGLGSGASTSPSAASTNFHEAKEQLVSAWERDFVLTLLRRAGGNVSKAAREAGMDRVYLHRLIKKHGIAASNANEM